MICPNCEYIFNAEEILDIEYYNNCYYSNVIGRCPKCHKTYQWTEVYTFSHITDVQENKVE